MKALSNAQLCNIVHIFKTLTMNRRFTLNSVALEVMTSIFIQQNLSCASHGHRSCRYQNKWDMALKKQMSIEAQIAHSLEEDNFRITQRYIP